MRMMKMYNSRIPSNITSIGRVVDEVIEFLCNYYGEMEEDKLFEFRVVLNELIVNAVRHGNKGNANKFVNVTAGINKNEEAFFLVEDEGEGYDFNCIKGGTDEVECPRDIFTMKETGRGIIIVKNLCDKVKFNSKGNKVLVVKKMM